MLRLVAVFVNRRQECRTGADSSLLQLSGRVPQAAGLGAFPEWLYLLGYVEDLSRP